MGFFMTFGVCELSVSFDVAAQRLSLLTKQNIADLWDDQSDFENRNYHEEALFALKVVCDADRNDTSSFQCACGKEYIMTGGPSWGDSPTDSFDDVERIDKLMITTTEDQWEHFLKGMKEHEQTIHGTQAHGTQNSHHPLAGCGQPAGTDRI